jgi:hypothetical protein
LVQRIAANSASDFECLVTQIGRFVDRYALTATETMHNFVQDGPDRVGNLRSGF